MKTQLIRCLAVIAVQTIAFAQTTDPIADFKIGLDVSSTDKILKWECDMNGDGKKEILLSLKSDLDRDTHAHQTPAWTFYIGEPGPAGYFRSKGTERQPGRLSVDDLPLIDPSACFVGQITELGKSGIVTLQIDNPREAESVGKIYAYTLEGDHLKRSDLAQYIVAEGSHPLLTKYLADDKRTHVQLEELAP